MNKNIFYFKILSLNVLKKMEVKANKVNFEIFTSNGFSLKHEFDLTITQCNENKILTFKSNILAVNFSF
jgi:hypothetical protein